MPLGLTAACTGVQLAVFGLYTGCCSALTHKGMPVVPAGARVDDLRSQVLVSRHVTGGRRLAAEDARTLSVQLQGALDSRVIIEEAEGVLAGQLGTSVDDASLLLRAAARRHGADHRPGAGAGAGRGAHRR